MTLPAFFSSIWLNANVLLVSGWIDKSLQWAIKNTNTSQKTNQRTLNILDTERKNEAEAETGVEVVRIVETGEKIEVITDQENTDIVAVPNPINILIMNRETIRQGMNTTNQIKVQVHREVNILWTMWPIW